MAGWRKKRPMQKVRAKCFFVLVLMFWPCSFLFAKNVDELTLADMDLIEFLGSWETQDGEWLDPSLFDEEAKSDQVIEKIMDDPGQEEQNRFIETEKDRELVPSGEGVEHE